MRGSMKASMVLALLLASGCQAGSDTDGEAASDSGQAASAPAGGGAAIASLDPEQCGGYSAADAAALLVAPADQWTRRVDRIGEGLWSCSLATGDGSKNVVFSIEIAANAEDAADQMEQYRSHLGDNYSDLMGLGDEGVWTEVNQTVTYRKQNVTIQVQQPADKMEQLKVVRAIFDKN